MIYLFSISNNFCLFSLGFFFVWYFLLVLVWFVLPIEKIFKNFIMMKSHQLVNTNIWYFKENREMY